MTQVTPQDFIRVNNDVNGNPRYVCHFLNLLPNNVDNVLNISISGKYSLALSYAKKLGGKKFHNKQYGGGIVFQSYNIQFTCDAINKLLSK